ncbi:Bifunctional NAD(P)H-hydrate repair enzyme Nnr [termite gut metagenome]|uniref:Nicotinamide nucleotide repair protein n=1 Tax=termite gut metagenome TaxID=433724 RepID=A0A5J4SEP7_9ZZZZ
MKIFPCNAIKKLDAYTMEHGNISSVDLMEQAARAITDIVIRRWQKEIPIVVFAGPGNNGGDALAVARMLIQKGYKVETYLFNIKGHLSPDCQLNKELLEAVDGVIFTEVNKSFNAPQITENSLIIDGLFGTGLKDSLNGGFAAVVKYINEVPATVVSIDIPSGLSGDEGLYDNSKWNNIVHANLTLSLQLPKLAFLFPENEEIIGEWQLIDIGLSRKGIEQIETNYFLVEEEDIRAAIKPRKKFSNKGDFGHALLIAGSYGIAGASVLAARACLRSGIGRLTIHAPICNNDILQITVPEAMVEQDVGEYCFSWPSAVENYQALGIGPGLGISEETENAVLEQLKTCQLPTVIDADALNLLAKNRDALKSLPPNSVLTPHFKELERLTGKSQNSYERLVKAFELAETFHTYVLLKGAYSALVTPQKECFFNPTGNTGMATAGSGDVLTGIILALLAQGYSSEESAKIGAYIHGLAGDLAWEKYGMISLTAGDIIDFLPEAWKYVNNQ